VTKEETLAELLHKAICTSNHIDMCDWEYSEWHYPKGTKIRYLDKANKMLAVADLETIKAIVELI